MNILMIGNQWLCQNEVTDEVNIRDALRCLGHQVIDYNWFEYEDLLAKRLPGEYIKHKPEDHPNEFFDKVDFTIVSKRVTPKHIQEIKALTNAPVFYWTFDLMEDAKIEDASDWDGRAPTDPRVADHPQAIIECDGFFHKEQGWASKYKSINPNSFFLPEDAAPPTHGKLEELGETEEQQKHENDILGFTEESYPVIFTGTYYDFGENRPQTLREIQEKIKPIELTVFGYNWDAWVDHGFKAQRGVVDKLYRRLIAKSKINLSLDWRTDIEGFWSDRIAQIQASGGFVLAKFIVGMERAFGPDKETCVYWNTVDDCAEKIKYYLEHDDERLEILERGYQYAHKYMTFDYRVRQFLTILDMKFNLR